MTLYAYKDTIATSCVVVCLVVLALASPADAQVGDSKAVAVSAVFGDRVKVAFDRASVALDTVAYDPDSVTPITAAPLTVSARARVPPNQRIVMTIQADGPLRSGSDTIPERKLTWTIAGDGFDPKGMASAAAAHTIGTWRGSGSWSGTQVYEFADSWAYTVGAYSLVMNYTIAMP